MFKLLPWFADTAGSVMTSSIQPIVLALCGLAGLVCTGFLINGGLQYITSSGKPENLIRAKKILRDSIIGLIFILAAVTITTILSHSYGSASPSIAQNLPNLGSVKPSSASFSLVDVIVKAITGLLNYLIQLIGQPIIKALGYFTSGTPLMAENPSVFKLWLIMTSIADSLFVLVIILLGFHVMSASSLGLGEISIRHLLPRIGLAFLLVNSSIFIIDAIISLSNAMISAIYSGFGNLKIWDVLTAITKQASLMNLAALIIMMVFLVLAFILLVYYVGRLVSLYLGAVLAPLIFLLWLLPSFQDFAATAIKTYLSTVFVLFVHVVILLLAGSLLITLVNGSSPDPIMSLVVGLSTLIALIKTQGVLTQLNYVSIGPKSLKKLSGQLMNGLNHLNAV